MTIEAVEYFTTVLNLPEITEEVGTKIFWDLAEEKTTYPFVVFELADEGYSGKDGIMTYNAKVRVFAKTLTQAVTIGSKLRKAVKASEHRLYDRGSISGYVDGEAKDAFMDIQMSFKHK